MKASGRLKEGWVEFTRIPCTEGFIDYFMGDMADDPNREKESQVWLNAFDFWYRLNGAGVWVHKDDFIRNFSAYISISAGKYTADEIWNAGLLKK